MIQLDLNYVSWMNLHALDEFVVVRVDESIIVVNWINDGYISDKDSWQWHVVVIDNSAYCK